MTRHTQRTGLSVAGVAGTRGAGRGAGVKAPVWGSLGRRGSGEMLSAERTGGAGGDAAGPGRRGLVPAPGRGRPAQHRARTLIRGSASFIILKNGSYVQNELTCVSKCETYSLKLKQNTRQGLHELRPGGTTWTYTADDRGLRRHHAGAGQSRRPRARSSQHPARRR